MSEGLSLEENQNATIEFSISAVKKDLEDEFDEN
jgi:hypothetical protein